MGKALAIEGHTTRGNEVIELLEMLGGKNNKNLCGYTSPGYYYINYGEINCNIFKDDFIVYTLEEYFQKFPFKVGDKVCIPEYESELRINDMSWNGYTIEYTLGVNPADETEWYTAEELLNYNDIEDYKNIESKNIKSNNEETIDVFKANTKEIDDKIYTNISQLKVVNDIDMSKNIFGYKPDDIVFVDEINWVKITNKFWDSYKKEFFYKGVGLINQKVYDNISHKNIKAEMLLPIFNVNNNEHNSIDRNVNDICDDILINQITNKVAIINLKSDVCDNEVELNLGDYEIEIRNNKTYAVLKKPKYPKTYEECCKILMGKTDFQDFSLVLTKLSTNKNEKNSISPEPPHITLINNFYKLLICRDAYWKIAGEEMGLGKPWEPDWSTEYERKYVIEVYRNKVRTNSQGYSNTLLAFPTVEMRNAFYENFKNLIEDCKELL